MSNIIEEEKKKKNALKRAGATVFGSVCGAVMLLGGGAMLAGCDSSQPNVQPQRGESAYEIAVRHGFEGTEEEWLLSLQGAEGTMGEPGETAYDIAVRNGFVGTEEEWLDSLGSSSTGQGKSAYDIYLETVPAGETAMTKEEWIASLKGEPGTNGKSAYEIAVANGTTNAANETEWLLSLVGDKGADGKSAYDLYVETVPAGETAMTKAEWLASLKGEAGTPGTPGTPGEPGAQGVGIANIRYAEDASGQYIVVTLTNNTEIKVYMNKVVNTKEALVDAISDENITSITVSNDITIDEDVDLSGKTIIVSGTLTFGNGTDTANVNISNTNIQLESGAELVVANADLTVDSGSSLEINGGNISIADTSSVVVKDDAEVVISGATITSDITVQADASANVDVSNCTINGDFSVETYTAPITNPSSGSARIVNNMVLDGGNAETPEPEVAITQTGIALTNVTFKGNVNIDADLEIVLKDCRFGDNTKTMTVKNGTVALQGESYGLLTQLTVTPAQDATPSVEIYAEDATALSAAGAFDSEYKVVYMANDIAAESITITTNTAINGQGHQLMVGNLSWDKETVNFSLTNADLYVETNTEANLNTLLTLRPTSLNIRLTADIALTAYANIQGNVAIDLNEKTVSSADSFGLVVTNGTLSIMGGTVTAKNAALYAVSGTTINIIDGNYTSTNSSGIIAVGGTLNITDATVHAQEFAVLVYSQGTATINGGTFTTVDNAVIGTNGTKGWGGNTITINGGTFNGNIQTAGYIACGIYVANSDTVTVNGGTFNIRNGVGIVARSGNTTISDDVVFNITSDGTVKAGKVGDAKINIEEPKDIVLDLLAQYPGGTPTVVNNSNYQVYTLTPDSNN